MRMPGSLQHPIERVAFERIAELQIDVEHGVDLMSVSSPGQPGEGKQDPGLCPGPAKGRALGTSDGCDITAPLPLPNDPRVTARKE